MSGLAGLDTAVIGTWGIKAGLPECAAPVEPPVTLTAPLTGPLLAELSAAGVKRISMGVSIYTHVAASLQDAATALANGDIASATSGMPFSEVNSLLDQVARG